MSYAPNDYALVIGINSYPKWNNGAKSLQGAVSDAEHFHKWLTNPQGGGLNPLNAKLILSTNNNLEPRQSRIDDAFGEIRDQSKGKDRRRFYFYFSGHGHSRGGSWQQQSLCLANWSPEDAGAALHLESYLKASIGCLKFAEAVFFIDCCRVRAIAPLGKQSDLECGDPDKNGRYSAIVYGCDQYTPTYEGELNGEIRGYFTFALLKILEEGAIELRDLINKLKVVVPQISGTKKQTVSADQADTIIVLGRPNPPDDQTQTQQMSQISKIIEEDVQISVSSNLTGSNFSGDPNPPSVGNISILRNDLIVRRGLGSIMTKLPSGSYEVRIDHAEASESHHLEVMDVPVKLDLGLPRRASATLLSSTIDKREWLTGPVVAASRWNASDGEQAQAVFISLRSNEPEVPHYLEGHLWLGFRDDHQMMQEHWSITEANTLQQVPPGMSVLNYRNSEGSDSYLPLPIADGWDTHVFILTSKGRPQLATASVSMRPAGLGFDPSDALIDAYERGIADLVTGGPGPDPHTLELLLWGKYRNPLFGLLGAHFLIRKLRRDGAQHAEDINRLSIVTDNLGRLLGADAPDVVALRIWKQLLIKEQPIQSIPVGWPYSQPLFNVGFQAFIEASVFSDESNEILKYDYVVALGLDANSPWTVWRQDTIKDLLRTSDRRPFIGFELQTAALSRGKAIERLWRDEGSEVETQQVAGLQTLRANISDDRSHDIAEETIRILRIPESVIGYIQDAIDQCNRKGESLDFSRLVRRTMLPLNVLKSAKFVAEQSMVTMSHKNNANELQKISL